MPSDDTRNEVEFITDRLVEKVWQGDQSKRGLASQVASVAVAAINDYTAQRYMETADQFTGEDIRRAWLAGHLAREARASVALDGETVALGPITVGEFFEEDEPVADVVAAFERGQHELTHQGEVIPASPELVTLGEQLQREVDSGQ